MANPIVQLFYNRSAGGHCPDRLAALRSGFEDRGARVLLSECGPGLPIEVGAEASHVCVVGGDGTVRHVAIALARCGRIVPLSVYPAGTINLVHRERLLPTDPAGHASRLLGEAGGGPFHPAALNDTFFLACASVGPDSRAVAEVSLGLKRRIGKLAYAVAFGRILIDWRRSPIRLRWHGGALDCEAFYVAKGRYFAGPWSFAPEASVAEPLLHVVALATARRRDFARFAFALWRGRRVDALPGITAFTCTALEAEADAPLPIQADGDPVGPLPASLSLHGEALSLC
ncbi:MAG: diacylglycerol kinase [Sphingomonadales bacterium]|jgi:diacylglycerol kinase family enzyme|nr:diacylglycerol kinase [Sphingomonadales bacterium]